MRGVITAVAVYRNGVFKVLVECKDRESYELVKRKLRLNASTLLESVVSNAERRAWLAPRMPSCLGGVWGGAATIFPIAASGDPQYSRANVSETIATGIRS